MSEECGVTSMDKEISDFRMEINFCNSRETQRVTNCVEGLLLFAGEGNREGLRCDPLFLHFAIFKASRSLTVNVG